MGVIAESAADRARLADAQIRDLLADGAHQPALYRAIRHLQGELAKVRRRRPADAALIDAQLAGSLLAIAAQIHAHKPERPAGCPRFPLPPHLLAAYVASNAEALEEGNQ